MEYTQTDSFGSITSNNNGPFKEIWKIMIFGGGHFQNGHQKAFRPRMGKRKHI